MRDFHIREAMLNKLRSAHQGEDDARIVQEMGVWAGTVRVDIAVLNGEMVGYELKSDSDTLARLPAQAGIYNLVFDRMTLVAGDKHFDKAKDLVPSWWGLVRAVERDGSITLQHRRKGRRNTRQDPYVVAELLRKDEAIFLLERFGLANGWRSKRAKQIHERLASELPFAVLRDSVRETLKSRPNWLGQDSVHQFDMPVDAQLDPVL